MELEAKTREITGKKVKTLRRQGITPVNLVGHKVEPMTLQCDTLQLKNAMAHTGTTGLLSLKINNAKKPRSVMFREVQREPVTGELLHIDLYQVNMDEKIKVEVPIVIIGEAPALKMKENFLAHELTSLFIECLPGKIPNRVEVNVSTLTVAGQGIHVKDLNLGEGIVIVNSPEQAVAKISIRFVEKEVVAEVVAAEPGAETPEGEVKEEGKAAA